eukprot:1023053-Prorocentrum_minimum.AAC.2
MLARAGGFPGSADGFPIRKRSCVSVSPHLRRLFRNERRYRQQLTFDRRSAVSSSPTIGPRTGNMLSSLSRFVPASASNASRSDHSSKHQRVDDASERK